MYKLLVKIFNLFMYVNIFAGPPNAGKNWFFDMVTAYYLNVGYCANYVRGQNFPFNDCPNRRVLIWNEPSIMNSAFDSVKMLCAGDPMAVSVKYQNNEILYRTPLIFLSNRTIFPNDPVWSSRVFFEKWKTSAFLKEHTLYPHPLCWYELVKQYVFNQV